jgi:O-antigen ligase
VTLALVADHVASTVFAVFFLAGLWLLLFRRGNGMTDRNARWVLLAFAAYFLVGVVTFFLGEQTRLGEKILGRDIRFLGAVPVYFVFLALALPRRLLRHTFGAAGIVTGVLAIAEVLLAEQADYRAGGRTISIVFGHLAAGLFAINLALALFERRGWGWSAIGALLAIVAVVLSGTRGAWLSVVTVSAVAIVAVVIHYGRRSTKRSSVAAVLAVVLAVLATALAGSQWITPRVQEGMQQYAAYRDAIAAPSPVAASQGCLSDAQTLTELVRYSEVFGGISLQVVDLPAPLAAECAHANAIRLVNDSARLAAWLAPYRNLPVGASGRLLADGSGSIGLEEDERRTDIQRGAGVHGVDIPTVAQVDRTRFLIYLKPGEQVTFVPVEASAGEYGFVAMDSSIGHRLDMWAATLRQIDFSLLGQGVGTWPLAMVREAETGRVAWRLSAYDHAHNDYLNALLERGWLGLAALLALLIAPLAWSVKHGGTWPAMALVMFVTSFAVSALTETVFNHSIGITYYAVLVLLLMTAHSPDHTDIRAN